MANHRSTTHSFFSHFNNNSRNNILDQEDGKPIKYNNQPKGNKMKKDKVIKIEPKVSLQMNKRLFHGYNSTLAKICGELFLFISMLLAVYALARFQYRAWQLRTPTQTGRFDDLYGPTVFCILIVTALVINFWLRFSHIEHPSDHLHQQ